MLSGGTQRGLSLIELMVGLAVFGILIMTAMPSYTAWIQNTKIRNAAESVMNGLQLARSEAVRRNAAVQFVLGTDSDWTVSVVGPPVNTIQSRSSAQGSVGVTVNATPGGARAITFDSLGRVVPNPDASASITQVEFDVPTTVLSAEASRNLRVVVSTGGRIRMCDPTVADAKDARVC